ncbi:MAG TPA: glyceraldehyde-3-phosphate dehydrogenase [Tabrizicola sp.]|nr:glyceraldehyde-3-phosphate dehydrogenase [Tabrizicola sp.]
MTNTIALWLGLLIVAGMIADFALNGGSAAFFVARKFLDLIEWVDFWN